MKHREKRSSLELDPTWLVGPQQSVALVTQLPDQLVDTGRCGLACRQPQLDGPGLHSGQAIRWDCRLDYDGVRRLTGVATPGCESRENTTPPDLSAWINGLETGLRNEPTEMSTDQ
mgnify:CR=1 FL=1